jgi:hypothetical protein
MALSRFIAPGPAPALFFLECRTEAEMEAILPLVLIVVLVPLALLLLAATGRLRALPSHRGQGAPTLFQVIEALIRRRPFTRHAVRRITGTTLWGLDSDNYLKTFVSDQDAKATIQAVELRIPTSASSKKDGLVILTVNTRARITPEAVMKHFGSQPEFHVQHPEVPYGCTYRYRQPWGDLSFQFTPRTEYLESVAIDAIESQPAAGTGPPT